jgi:Ca2+-binding RTX toxin-like protein
MAFVSATTGIDMTVMAELEALADTSQFSNITATSFRVETDDLFPASIHVTGNFTLNAGKIVGGNITSIDVELPDGGTYWLSDFSVGYAAFISHIQAVSPLSALTLILGSADTLFGSTGDDVLWGDAGSDEIGAGDGNDAVLGGAGNDKIWGGDGNDTLNGGSDHDRIVPGLGTDGLAGGGGNDAFIFDTKAGKTNVDTIADFDPEEDWIELAYEVFRGIGVNELKDKFFHVGTSAKDGLDRIIYNDDTGALFYDRDGSGDKYGKVKVAVLDGLGGTPTISADDFFITV